MGDLLEPNLEAIAAARPDLILTSKVRHEAIYDQLSAIAPTIMSESAGAGWKDNIRLDGRRARQGGRSPTRSSTGLRGPGRRGRRGRQRRRRRPDDLRRALRRPRPFRLYQRASFSGVVLDDAGLARRPTSRPPTRRSSSPRSASRSWPRPMPAPTCSSTRSSATRTPPTSRPTAAASAIEANPLWAGPADRAGRRRPTRCPTRRGCRPSGCTAPRPSSTTSPPRSVSTPARDGA